MAGWTRTAAAADEADAGGDLGEDPTLAEARQDLLVAVGRLERARAPSSRRDQGERPASRGGGLSASWILVDRFDAAGSSYIVARECPGIAAAPPLVPATLPLTPAERSVVDHAARGLSTKEIAYTLGISDTTVRVLIMRAVRRCGLRTRTEIVALARATLAEARELARRR